MKVSNSHPKTRLKNAEKPKSGNASRDPNQQHKGHNKGWRKAVEEDSSQLSDLSDSTDDGLDEEESLGERSEDYENFEKTLRSKHSKACKAMSVRFMRMLCFCFRVCWQCYATSVSHLSHFPVHSFIHSLPTTSPDRRLSQSPRRL